MLLKESALGTCDHVCINLHTRKYFVVKYVFVYVTVLLVI